jgi:hypothetical protein
MVLESKLFRNILKTCYLESKLFRNTEYCKKVLILKKCYL